MTHYPFRIEMEVRDYELDMQGIVNNSVYQNYIEHARHEYMKKLGLDYARYSRAGIDLLVIRAELDYKRSLTSGDRFWIGVRLQRESPTRFAFLADIYRLPDDTPVLKSKVTGTALNQRRRPELPEDLARILDEAAAT